MDSRCRVGPALGSPDWVIRMEHVPTGIKLYADSYCFRSKDKARRSLLSRMRSRLYMIQSLEINPGDIRIEYGMAADEEGE